MTLQAGGKIELTLTRLNSAIRASRSASSNDVSFSRCLPTPLVKKIAFPIGPIISPLASDKLIVFPSVMSLLNLIKHRIGVAMSSGTDFARESADVVLRGNDLIKFVETLAIPRWTRRIIWQNL